MALGVSFPAIYFVQAFQAFPLIAVDEVCVMQTLRAQRLPCWDNRIWISDLSAPGVLDVCIP